MPSKKKHMYRIIHRGIVLEGLATSPGNAMRQAFKTLIKQKRITRQPAQTNDGGFADTICQVIPSNQSVQS